MASSYRQALKSATHRAEDTGKVIYILDLRGTGDDQQYGPFTAADDEELETFFCGFDPSRVLYCTADGDN